MCVINKFHVQMSETMQYDVFTAKIPQKLSSVESVIYKET